MQYNERGEFIADDINFRFTLGSQYVSVETFYNLGLHIPTLSQRLEAAREEIERMNEPMPTYTLNESTYYQCSYCCRTFKSLLLKRLHEQYCSAKLIFP